MLRAMKYIFPLLFLPMLVAAQHNNELYNNGAIIFNATDVAVWGDMHMEGGTLTNNGNVKVQGHCYSDNTFQQRGAGTVRLENSDVNIGQTQFIEGSYAVRGGQTMIGVDDGSFYDLQLANDAGIVWLNGAGNVADVRNSVDFWSGAVQNRIITDDPSALPTNGAAYDAVFGIMNTTGGLASMGNNTVTLNGNMSGTDAGYVQGKLRRAIAAAGGQYGFVLGLEPAGAGAQRGMQYTRIDFAVNNYDVVTGYFQTGSTNVIGGAPVECGYNITYFGGADHGEWVFDDINGTGAGVYQMWVWPQDDNFPAQSVWFITKDDAISGLIGDCGPTPVGLDRNDFNGFSEFGVAAGNIIFPIELVDLRATPIENRFIRVDWTTATEERSSHFDVERSTDNVNFQHIGSTNAAGTSNSLLNYDFDDMNVEPGILYHYRLRMVDLDGSFKYTHSVNAMLDPNMGTVEVTMYPNPLQTGDLNIQIWLPAGENVTVELFDAIGKRLYDRKFEMEAGANLLSIPGDLIALGSYMVRVEGQTFKTSRKLVKVQ